MQNFKLIHLPMNGLYLLTVVPASKEGIPKTSRTPSKNFSVFPRHCSLHFLNNFLEILVCTAASLIFVLLSMAFKRKINDPNIFLLNLLRIFL